MHNKDHIDQMKRSAGKAASLLKMLAHSKRLLILCHISRHELTVSELVKLVGLSQSALSQHLAKMRTAKLITAEKRGKSVYYRIARPEIEAILSTLYLIYCHNK